MASRLSSIALKLISVIAFRTYLPAQVGDDPYAVPEYRKQEMQEQQETARVSRELDQQEFAARRESAQQLIVMINGDLGEGPTIGAGILFGRDKDKLYILTANHVVRRGATEARNLMVKVRSQPAHALPAKLLPRFDAASDLAVLSIEGLAKNGIDSCALYFSYLDPDWKPARGAAVYAVGNPNGMNWAMSVNPELVAQVLDNQVMFQSTFISRGHSGGGLINEYGYLVGLIQSDQPPYASALLLTSTLATLSAWNYPVELKSSDAPYGTLLNEAAAKGNIAEVQRSLSACSNPNALGNYGLTPLHEAAAKGQLDVMKVLLDAGADPNFRSSYSGETPLQSAAGGGQLEATRLLLSHGARIDDPGTYSWTALHAAAYSGHANTVDELLAHGAKIDAVDHDGETPLHLAASGKHPDIVRLLIAHGANAKARAGNGRTALHRAANSADAASCKALLDAGADVNAKDSYGQTPLAVTQNGADDVVQILTARGGVR